MKNWKNFVSEKINESGVSDRSLEGFRHELDQLSMLAKGIMNPQVKNEIYQLLNPFLQQMRQVLAKYKSQNVGYSQRHQYTMGGSDSQLNPHPDQTY